MDWIATFFTLLGLVFNMKKHIACWPIWIFGNILWIAFALFLNDIMWSVVIINIVFLTMNILGWKVWIKEKCVNVKI